MIAGVVVLHVWALHVTGQNNPTGIEKRSRARTPCPSRPMRRSRTASPSSCFLILYAWFMFYVPNYLGHADNYIPANPAVTPPHIVPEWYFLPFYAILRAIPNKLLGVIALFGVDRCSWPSCPGSTPRRCARRSYRPLFRKFFWLFVAACIGLGYLGSKPPEGVYVILAARILTFYYFAFFLIVLPLLGIFEKTEAAAEFDRGGGARPIGAGQSLKREVKR